MLRPNGQPCHQILITLCSFNGHIFQVAWLEIWQSGFCIYWSWWDNLYHYNDVIISTIASKITSLTIVIPPPNEVGGGVYWIHLVRPSVRPSVCRQHGFRSISQVCFGISIVNFICMLMVAIGRSLLIFSDVTFKMAAWWPYWIFWFPDSNFTLALNINFKVQRHNTYVYG